MRQSELTFYYLDKKKNATKIKLTIYFLDLQMAINQMLPILKNG